MRILNTLNLIWLLSLILLSNICLCQDKRKSITDSTGFHAYTALKNDLLLIVYDTAYILNKRTYKLYKENYIRVLKKDPKIDKLLELYQETIEFQEKLLLDKEKYYQDLMANFDSLASTSNDFAYKTNSNINAINISLANATNQITDIQKSLDGALDKFKGQNKQKMKFGLGGFSIGIVVTTLIFLISN
jgi:hypothetical protein